MSRDKLNTFLHLQKIHRHQREVMWQILKIFVSTFTRLKASKPGRVLTYGRKFSTQTLKSSPTPFSSLFLDWLAKFFKVVSANCSCWQICVTKIGNLSLDTLAEYCVYVLKSCECKCGIPCAFRITIMANWSKGIWNLAL